jgi:hypothetical protein
MGYEKKLREEGTYTEAEIQTKITEMLQELEGMTLNELKEDDKILSIEECTTLKHILEKHETRKKSHIKHVETRIQNLEKEYNNNKHRKILDIDEDQLFNFDCVLKFKKMKQGLIDLIGEEEAQNFIKNHCLKTVYNVSTTALKSKQCNEPYEILLSDVLELENLDDKHGFDAVDSIKDTKEVYEYKPSSKTNSPSGTINDDSEKKIKKCEDLKNNGQRGWIILAGIDKENYTFNIIYKFPLEIYNEDRRNYFSNLKGNNKENTKQTRSTYPINISKSIGFCNDFNLDYYVWER